MDKDNEFTEYKRCSEVKTSVWQHFLRSNDGNKAECKICNKILKTSRTTSSLHNHLKQIHSISLHQKTAIASTLASAAIASTSQTANVSGSIKITEPPKKKTKLTHYFPSEESMEEHVSKLAAYDGLSFNVICISITLRKLFTKSGYMLPKSPHTFKKIIVAHSEQIKLTLKNELKQLKSGDCSFSASLDEWTSIQNIRYVNINLHSPTLKPNSFQNLGLVQIKGKGTAQNLHHILEQKLNDFGLTSNDVVCIVTDGASVMSAMSRRTSSFHQLCYAHGIQLAVLDVIYKTQTSSSLPAEPCCSEEPHVEMVDGSDIIESDTDFEEIVEVEDEEGLVVVQTRPSPIQMQLADNYRELVNKVSTVVKLFKKSPAKSDLLCKNADGSKELHLILDCKTRWSSLADMIKRFILLKQTILKSLIDLKSPITFNEEELEQLEEIADTLDIVKTAVESLCQRDANLFTAEISLKFMIQKLSLKQSPLSMNLVESLKRRIAQRRLPEINGTLKYLQNPANFYKEGPSEYPFENPSNERVKEVIIRLNAARNSQYERTDSLNISDNRSQMEPLESVPRTSGNSGTMKEQLEAEIQKAIAGSNTQQVSCDLDIETQINVEMALFDSGGRRPENLEHACRLLLTIPPTSVEAERVFSATGYLCNHLRTRMNQDSLDALCFLRSHYQATGANR